MEKAHVAAGGPFCGVRRRIKIFGVFTLFSRRCPNFWAFLHSFARRRRFFHV